MTAGFRAGLRASMIPYGAIAALLLGGSWIDCNDGGDHTAFLGTRGPVLESDAVWFFQAHPYGIKTEPYKSLPAGWPTYCAVHGTGTPPVSPGG